MWLEIQDVFFLVNICSIWYAKTLHFSVVPQIKCKRRKIDIEQDVETPFVPQHLIQIRASKDELNERINKFMIRKRNEIDISNIREFCQGDRNSEFTCARVDTVLQKRKDSKSHLRGNVYCHCAISMIRLIHPTGLFLGIFICIICSLRRFLIYLNLDCALLPVSTSQLVKLNELS